MAYWKARGRLSVHHIELFRYLLRLKRYKRKYVEVGVFRRGWVTLSANFRRRERHPTTTVGVRKLEWMPFRVVSKILQFLALCDHNTPTLQTDRQTNRQTSCSCHKRDMRPRIIACRAKILLTQLTTLAAKVVSFVRRARRFIEGKKEERRRRRKKNPW